MKRNVNTKLRSADAQTKRFGLGVYDLFAIRIILDAPREKEYMQCWQAFALITDMYQPNPKRMRDWLSVPKSNGYESLHTTYWVLKTNG